MAGTSKNGGGPNPMFEMGNTVYVPYEGGTHYQARVVKREIREHTHLNGTKTPMWYYLVHYMGWNKKFDEWVEETGCLERNPDVVANPSKKAKLVHGKSLRAKPQMSLSIPPNLKQHLIMDWDMVKKHKKLLPMPRGPSVEEILIKFVEARNREKGSVDKDAEQLANGIRGYFDRAVALMLLYVEERSQADELIGNGTLPSTVYGAEHLLRLLIKLPDILPLESSTEEHYRLLQAKLHELLEFMSNKSAEFLVPSTEYQATDVQMDTAA